MAEECGGAVKLEFIPLWDLDEHWPECASFLARALATQNAMSLESVYADIKRGKFLLWKIASCAAIVTEVQPFALEKVCMVVLCGGDDMEEWVEEADATLTRHAKALGCGSLMIVGREGWSRVLPSYKVQSVVMRKAL